MIRLPPQPAHERRDPGQAPAADPIGVEAVDVVDQQELRADRWAVGARRRRATGREQEPEEERDLYCNDWSTDRGPLSV